MTDYRYAWRCGWNWILSYLMHSNVVAALRQVYWVLLRGYIGEACSDCGRPYILWHAPDDLWKQFARGMGLCCPNCFDRRAEAQGICLRWRPELAHFDSLQQALDHAKARAVTGAKEG